jgi:hypothetical protein
LGIAEGLTHIWCQAGRIKHEERFDAGGAEGVCCPRVQSYTEGVISPREGAGPDPLGAGPAQSGK